MRQKSGYKVHVRNSQILGKKQTVSRSPLGTWAKDVQTRINILKCVHWGKINGTKRQILNEKEIV